ncbi:MAG: hypothetical protein HKN09_11010 [Saprospiraceae bacterium]|nr:hypothetical protein [Saprospiraceae bacterium]
MEFDKFHIKKKSWLSVGNYMIFDEEENLKFKVKSNPWKIKKVFEFISIHNEVLYTIHTKNALGTSYDLVDQGRIIAHIGLPISFSGHKLKISTTVTEDFETSGNLWGTQYKFVRGENEFGIISYKGWSTGDFGVAIKQGEPIPLILAVVIILAYLKENGAA